MIFYSIKDNFRSSRSPFELLVISSKNQIMRGRVEPSETLHNNNFEHMYSHKCSHIYILLSSLNVVQFYACITNTFIDITLVVICMM